jgi:hypothetical protein
MLVRRKRAREGTQIRQILDGTGADRGVTIFRCDRRRRRDRHGRKLRFRYCSAELHSTGGYGRRVAAHLLVHFSIPSQSPGSGALRLLHVPENFALLPMLARQLRIRGRATAHRH